MDKKKQEGYVTGLVCLLIFAIFAYFTAISISNTSAAVIMGIFTTLFGGLGFGSMAKPETVGAVASQFLRNLSKSSEEGSSDSHNKQIQRDSHGSVQVMGSEKVQVNINLPREEKKKDAKGNTRWDPPPKINFILAQRILRKLQLPQVGWEAFNKSPYQLNVRIEVHPFLGGRELYPNLDDDINGKKQYGVEPMSALFGNGCFSLPPVCATSTEELVLEIRARAEDVNDPEKGEYEFMPSRWKYVRKDDSWSYYPQR